VTVLPQWCDPPYSASDWLIIVARVSQIGWGRSEPPYSSSDWLVIVACVGWIGWGRYDPPYSASDWLELVSALVGLVGGLV